MQNNFLSTFKSKIPRLTGKKQTNKKRTTLTTGNSAPVIVYQTTAAFLIFRQYPNSH